MKFRNILILVAVIGFLFSLGTSYLIQRSAFEISEIKIKLEKQKTKTDMMENNWQACEEILRSK